MQCVCVFFFKGALDKYNIYLMISKSVEDIKLNPLLPADSAIAFSFYDVFCETFVDSISPVCPIGYCIVYLLKSTLKNRKC